MLNFKKRLLKRVSVVLSVIMLVLATLPSAALAYYPYYGHGYHHHHRYDSHWTKHDTATLAGLAGVIGLFALLNNGHKSIPSDPVSYAEYRDKYVAKLNPQEQHVCNQLLSYPAGKYKTAYTQESTVKMVKKLCKKLPKDLQFIGTRAVRFTDGSVKNYIYFNRMNSTAYSYSEYSSVVVE